MLYRVLTNDDRIIGCAGKIHVARRIAKQAANRGVRDVRIEVRSSKPGWRQTQ
jgi:hypothetical protein